MSTIEKAEAARQPRATWSAPAVVVIAATNAELAPNPNAQEGPLGSS